MILYLDTSALAKRYIREDGTEQVAAWVREADVVGTSLVAAVEMSAVLGRLRKMAALDEDTATDVLETFRGGWPAYVRLPLSEATATRAGELAFSQGLRGYDAVHLATAMLWGAAMAAPVVLATFDRQLHAAAQTVGVATLPQALTP